MTDITRLRELDKAATTPREHIRTVQVMLGEAIADRRSLDVDAMVEAQRRLNRAGNQLPALLDELDALRAVAEAARDLVAAEDQWLGGLDPQEPPPSIQPLEAALRRLDGLRK